MRLSNSSHSARRFAERGMTLIEILVVVLIIGMILGMVGTNVFGIFGQAKDKVATNEIRGIVENIKLYRESKGKLPEDLAELVKSGTLSNAEEDGTVLDPWNRPYIYSRDQSVKDGFLLMSKGADENAEEDDIRSDKLTKN